MSGNLMRWLNGEALDESLEQHDAKYHPNGYKEGDNCKFMEGLKAKDNADKIEPNPTGQNGSAASRLGKYLDKGPTKSELKIEPYDPNSWMK